MHRCDRRLQRKGAGRAGREDLRDQGLALDDLVPVPLRAVLVAQQEAVIIALVRTRVAPGARAGTGQEEQRTDYPAATPR